MTGYYEDRMDRWVKLTELRRDDEAFDHCLGRLYPRQTHWKRRFINGKDSRG